MALDIPEVFELLRVKPEGVGATRLEIRSEDASTSNRYVPGASRKEGRS